MREKKLEEVKNFVRKHSHKIVAITCLTSGYIWPYLRQIDSTVFYHNLKFSQGPRKEFWAN